MHHLAPRRHSEFVYLLKLCMFLTLNGRYMCSASTEPWTRCMPRLNSLTRISWFGAFRVPCRWLLSSSLNCGRVYRHLPTHYLLSLCREPVVQSSACSENVVQP